MRIWEAVFGPDHPKLATTLNNLARLYRSQGEYAAAEPLIKRALQIRETALGPNHPSVADSMNDLASLYGVRIRSSEALTLFHRGLAIQTRFLQDVFSRSKENQQYQFLQSNLDYYYGALSLVANFLQQDSQAIAIGADLVFARKGLVHESQARTTNALLTSLSLDQRPIYQKWQDARATRGNSCNIDPARHL